MKPWNLLRIAGGSILKNKMRSLLTMLGIIIGVAAVIVLVAVGEGARSQIRRQVEGLGTNLLVITAGSTSQGGANRGAGSFNRLTLDDAEKLRREAATLAAVSPVLLTFRQVVGGSGNWRSLVYGVSVDYQDIRDWQLASGTFFEIDDVRTARKAVVLGATVADALFAESDAVGQQIRLGNVPFQVVGVLARKGQTAEGSDQDDILLAPYTTVQRRLSGRQFIPQILASTPTAADLPAAREEVGQILREAHRLADWEEDDFTVRNQAELAAAAGESTRVMTILLAAIASISLLVGGIGIMNIMLVSVTERTREIGLRLAVGARGGDVLVQFLVESLVLGAAGGLLGITAGFLGAAVLGRVTGWSTEVSVQAVLLALGFSVAVGVFFGYYPARKAAALDPIEALRHE